MSRVFVCADLHFGHQNIIAYENRPFADTDEMNRQLVSRWNNTVKKNDTVFVLGDVAFCSKTRTEELVRSLNGRKILVMGNHDRQRSAQMWQRLGFDFVSPYPVIYNKFVVLMHEPPECFNDNTPYFYVYGHVHGAPDFQNHTEHSACVSLERLGYKPALLDDAISGAAYPKEETHESSAD